MVEGIKNITPSGGNVAWDPKKKTRWGGTTVSPHWGKTPVFLGQGCAVVKFGRGDQLGVGKRKEAYSEEGNFFNCRIPKNLSIQTIYSP